MSKKPYKEGSIADLAAQGFSKIQKLSKSSLITEKLSAINMILYLLILGIGITFYLSNYSSDIFVLMVIFALSLLFSSISLLIYAPILEVVVNLSKNKVEGLRISITILFIDLTLAIAAFLFRNELLIKTALGLIGLQLIVSIIGSFISIPNGPIKDKKVESSQIWNSLGKISIIVGIISFIIDIIMILVRI